VNKRILYILLAIVAVAQFVQPDRSKERREKLNFSRWNDPANREEAHECSEVMKEGEMPPSNYAFIHGHAQLTDEQRGRMVDWSNANIRRMVAKGRRKARIDHFTNQRAFDMGTTRPPCPSDDPAALVERSIRFTTNGIPSFHHNSTPAQ